MLVGFYMQYVMHLEPCPLCMTQRVFIVAVGVTALVAFLVNPGRSGKAIFGGLGALLAVAGGYFSSRQLYLQSLPADQVPACGPTFEDLLQNVPLLDALNVMLRGDGNCSKVDWTFLGVSIAGWTLVAFVGLVLFNLWQALRKPD